MAELAAVEACSEHPIGRALAAGAAGAGMPQTCVVQTGMGISGVVGEAALFCGQPALGAEPDRAGGFPAPSGTDRCLLRVGRTGARSVQLRRPRAAGRGGNYARPCARRGIRTVLLSGDSSAATERVAAEIGADEWHRGGQRPSGRSRSSGNCSRRAHVVAMIGDGVNDAPEPGAGRPGNRHGVGHGYRHAGGAAGADGQLARQQ